MQFSFNAEIFILFNKSSRIRCSTVRKKLSIQLYISTRVLLNQEVGGLNNRGCNANKSHRKRDYRVGENGQEIQKLLDLDNSQIILHF